MAWGLGLCPCKDVSEVPASSSSKSYIDCVGCNLPDTQITARFKTPALPACSLGRDFSITLPYLKTANVGTCLQEPKTITRVSYFKKGIFFAATGYKGHASGTCPFGSVICCDLYIENPAVVIECNPCGQNARITAAFTWFPVWYTKLVDGCVVCGSTSDTKNTSFTGEAFQFAFTSASCKPFMVYQKNGFSEGWLSE